MIKWIYFLTSTPFSLFLTFAIFFALEKSWLPLPLKPVLLGQPTHWSTECTLVKTSQLHTPTPTPPLLISSVLLENKDGQVVSPFHDIPLFANAEKTILNMVVEVPRWTNAKLEVIHHLHNLPFTHHPSLQTIPNSYPSRAGCKFDSRAPPPLATRANILYSCYVWNPFFIIIIMYSSLCCSLSLSLRSQKTKPSIPSSKTQKRASCVLFETVSLTMVTFGIMVLFLRLGKILPFLTQRLNVWVIMIRWMFVKLVRRWVRWVWWSR